MMARTTLKWKRYRAGSPLGAGTLESNLFTQCQIDSRSPLVRVPALTICQPFATLVCLGSKRTENRTWPSPFRGRILIHAGKSREWLETADETDLLELAGAPLIFGAAVCAASVVAWIRPEDAAGHLSWVRTHRHAHGPYCLVLEDIQPLPEPLPMRGGQKIFSAELPRDFAMELGFLNGPVLFGRVSGCGSIDSYALGSLSAYPFLEAWNYLQDLLADHQEVVANSPRIVLWEPEWCRAVEITDARLSGGRCQKKSAAESDIFAQRELSPVSALVFPNLFDFGSESSIIRLTAFPVDNEASTHLLPSILGS